VEGERHSRPFRERGEVSEEGKNGVTFLARGRRSGGRRACGEERGKEKAKRRVGDSRRWVRQGRDGISIKVFLKSEGRGVRNS